MIKQSTSWTKQWIVAFYRKLRFMQCHSSLHFSHNSKFWLGSAELKSKDQSRMTFVLLGYYWHTSRVYQYIFCGATKDWRPRRGTQQRTAGALIRRSPPHPHQPMSFQLPTMHHSEVWNRMDPIIFLPTRFCALLTLGPCTTRQISYILLNIAAYWT